MNYAVARKHMVDSQVRPNDVTDLNLQGAMEQLPREAFVPSNLQAMAYAEMDLQLFDGRYLLQARDFSKLAHAAGIKETDLVLDVGCGFGYSSVVLARLASMVMAIEADEAVVQSAEQRIADLAIDNVVVVAADLAAGLENQGPYDAIVLSGGAVEVVPDALLQQLKEGGRLVCIKIEDGLGYATVYTRTGDKFGARQCFEAMPDGVMSGFAADKKFVF